MLDLININIKDRNRFENNLQNNIFIDLMSSTNISTGEILDYPKKAVFHNMNIRVNKLYSKIVGSFHKLNNIMFKNQEHNFDDFTYNQFSKLLPYFIDKFDLEENNYLTKLELGFNIKLDYDPQKFIDNHLLMYDYKSSQKDLKLGGKADYKEFIKNDFTLKIYNKSKQYKKVFNIKDNILRIELKLTSKRKIQSFGINCLNDLLDKNKIYIMFEFLINELKKVIIIDSMDFDNLPEKDKEKLNKYTNPNYWQRIRSENKSYKVQNRLKKDFNLLINKYNLNKVKTEIEEKLIYKFWELINQNENELFEPNSNKG